MRVAVLFPALLAGCATSGSFKSLDGKVKEMAAYQISDLKRLMDLAEAVNKLSGQVLELAKTENFLLKELERAKGDIFSLEAGLEQSNKDSADLNEKVDKLGEFLQKKRKQIK